MLARPDGLFFEDSRALHKRFPQLAHNVIPRVHGTWPALTEAGVRRVEKLIKAKIVNVETHVDSELSGRIADRMSALRRVLDDDRRPRGAARPGDPTRPGAQCVPTVPNSSGTHTRSGRNQSTRSTSLKLQLAYGDGAPDRALARELARAIAPDDDPGALAMRIEPILSARSAEDAHHALDDFGIAKLDTTELEAVLEPDGRGK